MSNIDFEEIIGKEVDGYKIIKKLTFLPTAKRHVIKLNNIKAEQNIYKSENVSKSRELITSPVKSIAIFCNEYVPAHFPVNEYFSYTLTINGKNYDIVPINCNRNGTKIIRTTDYNNLSNYVVYLNEEIKSAFLTIKILTPGESESPYISNLKVLIGGNVNV